MLCYVMLCYVKKVTRENNRSLTVESNLHNLSTHALQPT